MGLLQEFREFAVRGNVIDMAVGTVIGAGFSKIVSSVVGDLILPAIGSIGRVDFSRYKFVIYEAAQGKEEVAIRFGTFIQSIIDFAILAAAIFIVVKLINAAKRKQAADPAPAPVVPAEEILLLREIRDELKLR